MKKRICIMVLGLFGFLPLISMFAQGFTGPNTTGNVLQVQTVTVAQAKNLTDNSLVKLTGNIVQSISREKFLFRDASGDIQIEIDRDLWALSGITLGANDRVEIGGELDVERRGVEVDVKTIRKL